MQYWLSIIEFLLGRDLSWFLLDYAAEIINACCNTLDDVSDFGVKQTETFNFKSFFENGVS
jgi:hypothetical protein